MLSLGRDRFPGAWRDSTILKTRRHDQLGWDKKKCLFCFRAGLCEIHTVPSMVTPRLFGSNMVWSCPRPSIHWKYCKRPIKRLSGLSSFRGAQTSLWGLHDNMLNYIAPNADEHDRHRSSAVLKSTLTFPPMCFYVHHQTMKSMCKHFLSKSWPTMWRYCWCTTPPPQVQCVTPQVTRRRWPDYPSPRQ